MKTRVAVLCFTSFLFSTAAFAQLEITKSFGAPTVALNTSTLMTITVTNNFVGALTRITLLDTLPAGLVVSTPNNLNVVCSGGSSLPVVATAGTQSVGNAAAFGTLLGGGGTCTVTVNVTGVAPSVNNNVATVTNIDPNLTNAAGATLTVLAPDVFLVRYAANLTVGDSYIDFTNTGASSTAAFPVQNGNICVNVYTFSPDEQLISCCSCPVTPNGLASLSVRSDLTNNPLTPAVPTAIVVKLVASAGNGAGGACNPTNVGTGTNVPVPGLAAWGTTIHALPVTPGSPATTYGTAETPFTQATLSAAELTRITTLCAFNQSNGSGFGVCRPCRLGALGAASSQQ